MNIEDIEKLFSLDLIDNLSDFPSSS